MKIISLPFWETIKRSFLCVFQNWNAALKIAAVWSLLLVYEMFTGLGSACAIGDAFCETNWMQNISSLLLALSGVVVATAFCRHIILKTTSKYGQLVFGMAELKYIGFNILLLLAVLVPSMIVVKLISLVFGAESYLYLFSWFLPIVLMAYLSRFYIKFAAIAVSDKSITLKKAFMMTKGNACKIFFGQIVIMLPIIVVYLAVASLFKNFELYSWFSRFVFVAFLIAVSILDSLLKASFYAHIYQYFTKYAEVIEKVEEK